MDITTEAGALFDNQPRRIAKISLLDVTIVNPCASSYLDNAARHAGHNFGDAVERKKNKYRGSFSANNSFLSLAMSTCGEVGSDMHAPSRSSPSDGEGTGRKNAPMSPSIWRRRPK